MVKKMDKYVHIEYLKDYLNRQIQAFEPCPDKYDVAVGIYNGLHRIPAADVAPVRHGKWIDFLDPWDREHHGKCSECGERYYDFMYFRFCHNCGARMYKDGDGE